MTYNEIELNEIFDDCRVLIVEDDQNLAQSIAARFANHGSADPVVISTMEEARSYVANHREKIDLAIVDVMLPRTPEIYQSILEHTEIAAEARSRLVEARAALDEATEPDQIDELGLEIETQQQRRAQALRHNEDSIVKDGGIELAREWRKEWGEHKTLFPILFLTAVGNEHMKKEGTTIQGGNIKWMVKRVRSKQLLEKCADLLQTE